MSGSPTEAEIQAQMRNVVDVLESTRSFADGTIAGPGGKLDVLLQSLEGEYTPAGLANSAAAFRAGLSSLVDPGRALQMLTPVLYEYGKLLPRGGYTTIPQLARALYEFMADTTTTVKSRNITYQTTPTVGGSNVGNGSIARLTTDERGYSLEGCHIETKRFRCWRDRNSGANGPLAEEFEVLGSPASQDSLLRAAFGSGDVARATLRNRNAGSGQEGSLLKNSSFSTYSASATPKFQDWLEVAGGAQVVQHTANFYLTHPNATVDASLRINGGGGTVTLRQPRANWRVNRLEANAPYFLRVMLNKTIGSASGGTVTIRMGSQTASITIASLASGWAELRIASGTGCWFRNFNEVDLGIEIEWSGSTSGYLLVDDVIFAPWDLLDGTYWMIRHANPTPVSWAVNDTITFADSGGAPGSAKIQWWWWVAGLGYLPSTTGTPSITDP